MSIARPFTSLATTVALALTLTACSNGGGSSAQADTPAPAPTTPNESPEPANRPARPWTGIKIMRSYTMKAGCNFVHLNIDGNGLWTSTQCLDEREGQLAPDELAKIESLAIEALDVTEGRACPQVLVVDADYVYIDATEANPESGRTFDPNGACYEGGGQEVTALLEALKALRTNLTDYQN